MEDRISGLPDDLLHGILLHLHCLPAAVRTSLFSRRWRRVWAGLPELFLPGLHVPGQPPSTFLRTIDGALAAYAALNDHVSALTITVPNVGGFRVPACHVAVWLRFASRYVAGTFSLTLPPSVRPSLVNVNNNELHLLPCGRATRVALSLGGFLLRPAAPFAALTNLNIQSAAMDGRELGNFVSSMCPCLTDLTLLRIQLVGSHDVSVCSASLKRLKFYAAHVNRLDVVAPMLEVFAASSFGQAHVSAPNLEEVEVQSLHQHHFADDVPRRLRRLDMAESYVGATPPPRMRRFDTVDELRLYAFIGMEGYTTFLDGVNNLPMCEILSLSLAGHHYYGCVPIILHVLKRHNGIRKFVLVKYPTMINLCPFPCPCRLPESHGAGHFTLDSLEEIVINSFTGGDHEVQFLKLLLSRCSATKLTNVDINMISHGRPPPITEVAEKVRLICRPNLRVRLHATSNNGISELVL